MNSRDFCYWLQGFFEITNADSGQLELTGVSSEQAAVIRNHLNMVFLHEIDPSMGGPEKQAKLNYLHGGNTSIQVGGTDPLTGMKMRC